jgi:LysM repeat protein
MNRQEENRPYNEQVARGEAGGIISEYIVEEKDTLQDIANRYGVGMEEIKAANPELNDADLLKPGCHIKIPRPMGEEGGRH